MYKPINGFTKELIIKTFEDKVKEKCTDDRNNCVYRGENGSVCAVGAFIPNAVYTVLMENKTVFDVLSKWPELKLHMPLEQKALSALQAQHDSFDQSQTYENITDRLVNWVKLYVED